jgi:hypothetical protein
MTTQIVRVAQRGQHGWMPRVFDKACGSADAILNDEFMQMSVAPRAGVVASRESRDSASPRIDSDRES